MTPHPTSEMLALFSAADLPLLERWKIRRHLQHCDPCEQELSLLRAARAELKRQARTEALTGFEAIADWSSLEREMEGNIVVGLAAARCIEKSRPSRALFVRFALATGMVLLFVLGWITRVPSEQSSRVYTAVRSAFTVSRVRADQGPVLRSLPNGIVVGTREGSLTLLHPASAIVSVSGTSSVEARYVDDETGQVTITNVYGQ